MANERPGPTALRDTLGQDTQVRRTLVAFPPIAETVGSELDPAEEKERGLCGSHGSARTGLPGHRAGTVDLAISDPRYSAPSAPSEFFSVAAERRITVTWPRCQTCQFTPPQNLVI